MTDFIYDIETYPNVFTLAIEQADAPFVWSYEISDYRNDSKEIIKHLNWMARSGHRMVGFNNLAFDYPVLHTLYRMGQSDAATLYNKAQAIINAPESDRFTHLVYPSDRVVPQLDLLKIHHFDNKARMTSLKSLEFNMRSEVVEDLPFPVGTVLTREQIGKVHPYNQRDVSETKKFYHLSADMIRFREELTKKYNRDFMNHNDTKIGKDYFIMKLEEAGIECYEYSSTSGRVPRQTPRPLIHLCNAILSSIWFDHPEFRRVLTWLKGQSITETKGVFDDLSARVNNFEFVFGTGGIHGSVESKVVEADDEYCIVDLDVASYYPNLAIANDFYPEHLGAEFCNIYKQVYEMRKSYPKGSAENAMLKLALNGVYGDSNNKFSVFYDPLYTMKITLNGQLLLCKLAEDVMNQVQSLSMVQINTDGMTVRIPRNQRDALMRVVAAWEAETGLTMESADYSKMYIRDVNNYIAVYTDGKVKRKGAYEYKTQWHQDASALVIPKVTEKVLVEGAPIRQTVEQWSDVMDFMMRTKVPRSSHLTINCGNGDEKIQNVTRYCVTRDGGTLSKWMPPLAKAPDKWRQIGIVSGRRVTVCNDLSIKKQLTIDYDYYINEVEKLCLILR